MNEVFHFNKSMKHDYVVRGGVLCFEVTCLAYNGSRYDVNFLKDNLQPPTLEEWVTR